MGLCTPRREKCDKWRRSWKWKGSVRNRKLILLKSAEMKQTNEQESEKKRMELEARLSELQSEIRMIDQESGATE